ncbi:Ras GTPase-activating protein 1 [Oopsacas minuta]|uniref:Ras GTPase-activating protein 1 n=1 Tax=Oopsacas minuta TaxID=111878 RepID=A0AAV7JUS3_9METZ|nr:Ras GTPase-activating protein 1 [Oopsacas minuta]
MRLTEILTPGAYLVRQSVNTPDTYSISFISSQGIIHFRIMFYTGSYFIGGRRFTCLSDIVGYYISYSTIVASETLIIPVPPKQALINIQTRIIATDNYVQNLETEELSFRRGDIFVILSEINEAWYWVKSNKTGETGMVPRDLFMDVTTKIDICAGKPWFHENIDRDTALELVSREKRIGSFLVRAHETVNVYVLIVRGVSGPLKFKILKEDYYFLGKRPYNSIEEILKHYKKEPIHEQICLGFPIPKRFDCLPIELPPIAQEDREKNLKAFKEKLRSAKIREREMIVKAGTLTRKERISFRTKWKPYYVQLHKDHKVIFKDNEKATKAKHLLDLKNCSINHVHHSMFFRDHIFLVVDYSLSQKRTHLFLACQTKEEYEVWFDALRTAGDLASGKTQPNQQYKTIRNLTIGVQSCEMQGAGTNYSPGYCMISLDGFNLGRTDIVLPMDSYKWDKEFTFTNLSGDLSTISVKFFTKGNLLRNAGGVFQGEITLYLNALTSHEKIDNWYKLNCKTGVRGKLKLKGNFQNEVVLPVKEYEVFQAALLDESLVALHTLDSIKSDDRNSLGASLVKIMGCCHSTHILIPKIMALEVKRSLMVYMRIAEMLSAGSFEMGKHSMMHMLIKM